jgi:Acetyl/propionyl-CoA carboxylase, alpha subunit
VRIESGVESGDEISPHYDSMIAKLIAHGPNRDAARRALLAGLRASTVIGLPTNLQFLQELLEWPQTRDASFHTRLIDERYAPGATAAAGATAAGSAVPIEHLAAAALYWLAQWRAQTPELGCWTLGELTGWRVNTGAVKPAPQPALVLKQGATEWPVRFSGVTAQGSYRLRIGDEEIEATQRQIGAGRTLLLCKEHALELTICSASEQIELASALGTAVLSATSYLGGAASDAAASGQLLAPMMGKVVAVKAQTGDAVVTGQTVVVLESMKMELHVTAPFNGNVSSLRCQVGDMVERHQVLAEVSLV